MVLRGRGRRTSASGSRSRPSAPVSPSVDAPTSPVVDIATPPSRRSATGSISTPPVEVPTSEAPEENQNVSQPGTIVGQESLEGGPIYTGCVGINDPKKPVTFTPDSIVRYISNLVIGRLPPNAPSWHKVPRDLKERMFHHFLENHKFEPGLTEEVIRKVFMHVAKNRLRGQLYNFRYKVAKATNNNFELARNSPPAGLNCDVWHSLCDAWSSEDWKKRSVAAKGNRASKPEAALHTGGSIPFSSHKCRLEDYNSKVIEKYGENPDTQPSLDVELWKEAGGTTREGSLRGLGTSVSSTGSATSAGQNGNGSFFSSFVQDGTIDRFKDVVGDVVDDRMKNAFGSLMDSYCQPGGAFEQMLKRLLINSTDDAGPSTSSSNIRND